MDFLAEILSNLVIFQIITSLISVTIGAGLCFGALKWRRGLLTTTAIGWGLFLGVVVGLLMEEWIGDGGVLICILAGLIGLPILTYTIPGVNRFVLGFLIGSKLIFMLTTVLAKDGTIDIATAIRMPLLIGTIVGFILMAWTRVRVSAFVLGCTFIGASQVAPQISELIDRIHFSFTGDYSILFDPIDILFALFKIELTDCKTLVFMILFMGIGGYKQIKKLKEKGIPLNTPIIGFESPTGSNGRIYTDDGYIDTME